MANNQRLIIVIAAVAVVVAVIAIVALVVSSNSSSSANVANLASPTVQQDENNVRTQVYAEMTSTAVVLAVTNQAGTLAAMQQTLNVRDQAASSTQPSAQAITATSVPQQGLVNSTLPPTQQPTQVIIVITSPPATQQPLVVTATPQPTQVVLVVTSPPTAQQQPLVVTATPQPQQPTTVPIVIVATTQPTIAQQGSSSSATVGTCSRSGDEINVGSNSTGACDTVSEADVLRIVQNASTAADAIAQLDRMCQGKVNACYQYRNIIPSVIPASVFLSQRILWGDTGYLIGTSQQTRIRRLKCDTNNQCVYLLTDNQPFIVENPGRGLLLDQSYQGS